MPKRKSGTSRESGMSQGAQTTFNILQSAFMAGFAGKAFNEAPASPAAVPQKPAWAASDEFPIPEPKRFATYGAPLKKKLEGMGAFEELGYPEEYGAQMPATADKRQQLVQALSQKLMAEQKNYAATLDKMGMRDFMRQSPFENMMKNRRSRSQRGNIPASPRGGAGQGDYPLYQPPGGRV